MPDSPEKYLRTRARTLPIGDCYITKNWKESGMAMILVSRKHVTRNLTFAGYQIDLYCLGVKDTFWRFNEPPEVMEDILRQFSNMNLRGEEMERVDYELVHNIVYGAEAFADDLGFRPHKDFALTKYILEEDNDKFEFIDIEFGLDGMPAVYLGSEEYPANVYKILDQNVGKGNYYVFGENGDLISGPEAESDQEPDSGEENQGELAPVVPLNRDMMDLDNERLMRFLSEQDFQSIEELNKFMEKNVIGKKIEDVIPERKGKKSNAEQADDIMYQAYQSDPQKGVRLANKALEVDPENVRAWNYLAQNEPDADKALDLFEKAALIAENHLGKAFFNKNKGSFWGIVETRPYMTARVGMADCLAAIGKIKEAKEIYERLIELNPEDNQGIRFVLSDLYLMSRNSKQYLKLFNKYKDDPSAYWLYNHAFFWYDTIGPGKEFYDALKKAIKANSHIFDILTGKEQVSKNPKEYFKPGDATEAAEYIHAMGELWQGSEALIGELKRFKNS